MTLLASPGGDSRAPQLPSSTATWAEALLTTGNQVLKRLSRTSTADAIPVLCQGRVPVTLAEVHSAVAQLRHRGSPPSALVETGGVASSLAGDR